MISHRSQTYNEDIVRLGLYGYTSVALNLASAYSYGVSGTAYYQPFVFDEDGDITDVWFPVNSYTSFTSTDKQLLVEVRNAKPDTTGIPDTLLGSQIVDLSAQPVGWVKTTFATPVSVNKGVPIYVIVGDPDGTATNFATVNQYARGADFYASYTTTNGFATNPAGSGYPACMAIKHAGVMYGGSLFGGAATTTSNTRMRGFILTPPQDIQIVGTSLGTLENRIYESGQLPNDTPLYTSTTPDLLKFRGPFSAVRWFDEPVTLSSGHTYYLVGYSASAWSNGWWPTFANPDSDILSLYPMHGACGWIEQTYSGSPQNSWAAPDYTKVPQWMYYATYPVSAPASGCQKSFVF